MSERTAPQHTDPPRTVLLRRGEVHSPADPFATAMVVEGGQVAWVGSEGAADSFADGVDEVIDLDGALVTPAFTDAHVHTTATGLALTGLDLSGAPSWRPHWTGCGSSPSPDRPTGSCSATAGTPHAGPAAVHRPVPNSTRPPAGALCT